MQLILQNDPLIQTYFIKCKLLWLTLKLAQLYALHNYSSKVLKQFTNNIYVCYVNGIVIFLTFQYIGTISNMPTFKYVKDNLKRAVQNAVHDRGEGNSFLTTRICPFADAIFTPILLRYGKPWVCNHSLRHPFSSSLRYFFHCCIYVIFWKTYTSFGTCKCKVFAPSKNPPMVKFR